MGASRGLPLFRRHLRQKYGWSGRSAVSDRWSEVKGGWQYFPHRERDQSITSLSHTHTDRQAHKARHTCAGIDRHHNVAL